IGIITEPALEQIVASASLEAIVETVPANRVIAFPADDILNRMACDQPQIQGHVHRLNNAARQIDCDALCGRGGEVESIAAARANVLDDAVRPQTERAVGV